MCIRCWGYTFDLTSDHLTPEQALPFKHSYDVLGEDCLKRLNEISPPPDSTLPRNTSKFTGNEENRKPPEGQSPPKRDLYVLLRDHAETDEKLGELWKQVNTIPDWVDWDQIARGQDVFYRYGGPNLTGLAYQSLLGGMGAARVVETLARTGGFSTKVARRRLYETTQHILEVTKSLDSIKPGGAGFASTVRVRLLHAAVRMRILKLAADRPDYYSVEKWGVPINDLDSVGTISTFSATLIWISLPRQGIWMRQQEIDDYIALWRYVGYLIGCPTDFFATTAKAKAVMESLLLYEIQPTQTSKILANNIIKSLESRPPTWASADMLIASARWLNGNDLADQLGLPRPSLYYWALMAGQCTFFVVMCYTYRSFPSWDKKKNDALRHLFYALIVDSKFGLEGQASNFDFKYVPEYSIITELEESEEAKITYSGVERRNLKWLLLAAGFLGVSAWCTFKVTGVLWRAAWNWS